MSPFFVISNNRHGKEAEGEKILVGGIAAIRRIAHHENQLCFRGKILPQQTGAAVKAKARIDFSRIERGRLAGRASGNGGSCMKVNNGGAFCLRRSGSRDVFSRGGRGRKGRSGSTRSRRASPAAGEQPHVLRGPAALIWRHAPGFLQMAEISFPVPAAADNLPDKGNPVKHRFLHILRQINTGMLL